MKTHRDVGVRFALVFARLAKKRGDVGSVKVWVGIARNLARKLRAFEMRWRKAL